MGTVKYSGPVASFHCPTNAEIRSLKVHFSPKQEGTGNPSPENVRPIVGWDGVVVHNDDGNMVPEEYQKVEYLESTGTQYLISNIPVQSPIQIETNIMFTANGDFATCCAGYETIDGKVRIGGCGYYHNQIQCYYGNYYLSQSIITNNKYHIKYIASEGTQTVKLNETIVSQTKYSHTAAMLPIDSTKINFYIFAEGRVKSDGSTNVLFYNKSKIYSLKVGNNTTTLGNFIPCRRKSDDKPGMYDTVSQTFFTNQGTGEFICGPDVGGTTNYEFGVLGKNKLNVSAYIDNEYVKSDGTFATNNSFRRTDYLHLASGSYVYSATKTDGTTAYVRVCGYDRSKAFVAQLGEQVKGSGNYEMAFTIPENVYYIILQSYEANTNEQIELGSTATTYEPYDPNHTVYGGWVDLITGEVCEEWKTVDIGSLSFYISWGTFITVPSGIAIHTNIVNVISDTYKTGYVKPATQIATGDLQINGRNGYTHTAINDSRYTTIEDFKTAVSGKQLTYKLATPITYSLAPTQLQTFLGQNNVWSNADYVEVEYDLHETQDILARKQFIIANQPHLATASGSFTTDMIAPIKSAKVYFNPIQTGSGDPSPNNVRAISGWTGIQVGLPSEYQRVEYLESSGTQLIDTGYIPLFGASDEFFIKFVIADTGTMLVWGCNNFHYNETRPQLPSINYRLRDDIATQAYKYFGYCSQNTPCTYYANKGTVTCLNVSYNYSTSNCSSNTAHLYLFGQGTSEKTTLLKGRIYEAWYKSQGAYIFNLIPCYRKSDSTPGMYDIISKTFYTNSGTGEFTYGPIVQEHSIGVDWENDYGTIYGGYVDLVSGEMWATQITETFSTTGKTGLSKGYDNSDSILFALTPTYPYVRIYNSGAIVTGSAVATKPKNGLCNQLLIQAVDNWRGTQYINSLCSNYSGDGFSIRISTDTISVTSEDTEQTKAEKVNNYLSQQPIIINYELQTPQLITTLTPTQLKTLRGTNNIWSNANGNIEIQYYTH